MRKKKHHFIPKFILRNFSVDNGIFQYRHDSGKIFKSSIEDAFAKKDLNTIVDNNKEEHTNLIEDTYDKYFEHPASLSIQKILNDLEKIPPSGKDFSADDFLTLLRFTILSNLRTPYTMASTHHATRVSAYGIVLLKYFMDFGTVNFPEELDIDKGMLFGHLEDFDESTRLLADLKLTLYYHRLPDCYFIIPDQFAVISSPNNCKFSDPDLKIYLPISSNVVVCFERIERAFSKGTCEIDKNFIEKINLYFLNNSYDSVGCQNKAYLTEFIKRYKNKFTPLTKFNPYKGFSKIKQQIQFEIISKLALNNSNIDIEKGFYTHLNSKHEFKILNESEFQAEVKKLKSTININNRITLL